MLKLSEINIFVTVAEELNFSAAAERLHLSQPAVSQNIRSLEKALDRQLFVRQGKSIQLSEAGGILLPLARQILDDALRMQEVAHGLDGQIAGELTVGCSTTSGKYILPSLMASFRRLHPAVQLQITILGRDEVLRRLLDGRLGLGVISKQIEHRDLALQPLYDDSIVLIAPIGHPWSNYGRAMVSDLTDMPLILRQGAAGTDEVLEAGLAQHGIHLDMLKIVMRVGNAEAIALAVEEGIGLAFVSSMAAARGLALGRVRKVEVEGLDLQRTVYMARNLKRSLTQAQETFWSFAGRERLALAERIAALMDPERPANSA